MLSVRRFMVSSLLWAVLLVQFADGREMYLPGVSSVLFQGTPGQELSVSPIGESQSDFVYPVPSAKSGTWAIEQGGKAGKPLKGTYVQP